jgi:hypothetical protein
VYLSIYPSITNERYKKKKRKVCTTRQMSVSIYSCLTKEKCVTHRPESASRESQTHDIMTLNLPIMFSFHFVKEIVCCWYPEYGHLFVLVVVVVEDSGMIGEDVAAG